MKMESPQTQFNRELSLGPLTRRLAVCRCTLIWKERKRMLHASKEHARIAVDLCCCLYKHCASDNLPAALKLDN